SITTSYFTKTTGSYSSDLQRLRLKRFGQQKEPFACESSFFDSNGYAYIQYNFGKSYLCDRAPNKPDIS
ncbi:hypothetical protein MHK_007098, partial [Candidatus Magnetomorum sp. HK-1]